MDASQRNKGARGEPELAKLLEEQLGLDEIESKWEKVGKDIDAWRCPSCHWTVMLDWVDDNIEPPISHRYIHCPCCGTTLIWF